MHTLFLLKIRRFIMNIVKKSLLLLGVSLICASTAHAGWQEIKETVGGQYIRIGSSICAFVQAKMGDSAGDNVAYVIGLPYAHPEGALAVFGGTIVVIVGGIVAYKKYTGKKAQAAKQEDEAEQQEVQEAVTE